MMSRVRRLAVTAACVSISVTGCSFGGLNSLPLPGTVGNELGSSKYRIELANVSALEPNSPVLVGDVVVGSVASMAVRDWHADVEITVKPDVVIPANALATVGQTSLLGSMHLALNPPLGQAPRGRLQPGERVLVTGAGGGMGRAAVQLAVHMGAQVVAVASSEARLQLAREAGAQEAYLVDREHPQIPVKDIDLVFDPVAGPLVMPLVKCLRRGGRYAIIGFVGGRGESVPLNRLLLKEIALIGVRAGEQGRQDPAAGVRHIQEIDARAVHMRPHIGLELPLAVVREAFAAMGEGRIEGKCVIRVS